MMSKIRNSYHVPIVRKARTLARHLKILNLLKRLLPNSKSYEEPFLSAISLSVKEGDVVWDVGANQGLYTRLFSEWTGKNGKVVAFEPEPETFANLSKELQSFHGVLLFKKALADKPGASFFVSEGANDVTAHLISEPKKNTIQVDLTTADIVVGLDSSLQPNVVKIDVEGFEEEVVKGGSETFNHPDCRHMFIEMHFGAMEKRKLKDSPNNIVKMLKHWHYRVRWVDASHIHAFR